MDWEAWKVVGAAVAGAVVVGKGLSDIFQHRWSRQREQYQFVRDYLVSAQDRSTHPYIVERGFRAITGETLSVPEIRYLLSFEHPSEAISSRVGASTMLEFSAAGAYEWTGWYRSGFLQRRGSGLYLVGYAIPAFAAIYPLLLPGATLDLVSSTTSALLGLLALASLNTRERLKLANRLIRLQRDRLPAVP